MATIKKPGFFYILYCVEHDNVIVHSQENYATFEEALDDLHLYVQDDRSSYCIINQLDMRIVSVDEYIKSIK